MIRDLHPNPDPVLSRSRRVHSACTERFWLGRGRRVHCKIFQTDLLGMTSTHLFSSSSQDFKMERAHGRRARRYSTWPRQRLPMYYDAIKVCEIHLTLLCGFNQRQQFRWLAVGQPVLLEPSPYMRYYPVATSHIVLRRSVGPRSSKPHPREFLFHTSAVIVPRRRLH